MKLKALLEILRNEMPQIRGKDIPDMLKVLDDNGIAYRKGKIAVNMLKPTQEDAISDKVDAIANDIKSGKEMQPIVISKNGYIMDGHHRWLAQKKVNGDNYSMEVIQLLLPKIEALKMFDKVADEVK